MCENQGMTESEKLRFQSNLEGWKAAVERHREDGANFLKYIITYSSALLGFSITMITTVLKDKPLSKCCLVGAWGLLIITIILGILSLKISQKANGTYAGQLQDEVEDKSVRANPYETACNVIEWILFSFVILATIANVSFMLWYL